MVSALGFLAVCKTFLKEGKCKYKKEEALARLENLLDATTHVTIIGTDTNGIITHFNKGAENLLGYKAFEIIGKTTPYIFHVPDEVKIDPSI